MKKETFEWVHSWCDNTNNADLPRVLLVGDSICHSYQELVREKLKGVAYVDYIATSYAVDSKIYNLLIENFAKDSKYDLIHLNHGLHGFHMSVTTYRSKMDKLIQKLLKVAPVILCESTAVNKEGNKRPHTDWMKKVYARNGAVEELAKKHGLKVNPLFELSASISACHRVEDGFHYLPEGADILADQVASIIKENLK